jgi:hypothetical protein
MNPKKLKKIIKRQTAKKRAQKQTSRRLKRLKTDRDDNKVAQDIYVSLKGMKGEPKSGVTQGEYNLKDYNYNMFEYGDPLKATGSKAGIAVKGGVRSANNSKAGKRKADKSERARIAKWDGNIKATRERKKKAERLRRKAKKRGEAKPAKKPTSRKYKMS